MLEQQDRDFAVIFDMDGLMFDTERVGFEAWRLAFGELGISVPDSLLFEGIGRTSADTRELFSRRLGPTVDMVAARARAGELFHRLIDERGVPVKPGLPEILSRLERLGIARAVATSTRRPGAEKLLSLAEVRHRFDVVICGDDISHGKPSPDIYLLAADRLGQSPASCYVLEDSEPGIQAAVAAGMHAFLIPDIRQPTPEILEITERVVGDLTEAADYFKDLAHTLSSATAARDNNESA